MPEPTVSPLTPALPPPSPVSRGPSPGTVVSRAFDEKVESIVDSHDGANQIQHSHWYKRSQS